LITERVVLDDYDLDRELVLHGRRELSHEHREAAVAHEADALPLGIGDLRGDRIGQTVGHRGEIS
jgi:hypothetical protein